MEVDFGNHVSPVEIFKSCASEWNVFIRLYTGAHSLSLFLFLMRLRPLFSNPYQIHSSVISKRNILVTKEQ